jgi:hypothetical protein
VDRLIADQAEAAPAIARICLLEIMESSFSSGASEGIPFTIHDLKSGGKAIILPVGTGSEQQRYEGGNGNRIEHKTEFTQSIDLHQNSLGRPGSLDTE